MELIADWSRLEYVLKITCKLEVYETRADVELGAHCLTSKEGFRRCLKGEHDTAAAAPIRIPFLRQLLRALFQRLLQSHACPSSILVDEFNAG
jgi:hypothetical protein